MNNLFASATLKLTAWYLLILMLISLVFSVILYQISSAELRRSLREPGPGIVVGGLFFENEAGRALRDARYHEGSARITGNLIILNIGTLLVGGGLSYMLARRTLQPIHEAMEAQGRFTSDASHELRTPLTVMQSEIEVGLRGAGATKADYKKLLESNLDEVKRLHELSDRLLQLASQRELALAETALDEVAIDAVGHVVKIAQQKHMKVINEVGSEPVQANREALADALTILLDNALKYGQDGSTITMSSAKRARTILLQVSDQGPGIASEDLPHIFDRFYRADTSRTRTRVEGYGLGLSIARRIVRQHGGELLVESELGVGSTFTIRLPRP